MQYEVFGSVLRLGLMLGIVFHCSWGLRADTAPEGSPTPARAPVVGASSAASGSGTAVTISVMVRASDGAPVRGLQGDDFVVEERGRRYAVEVVQPSREFVRSKELSSATQPNLPQSGVPTAESEKTQSIGTASTNNSTQTHLLLLLPPMHSATRTYTLNSLIRHLQKITTMGWDLAMLDPSARLTPFTRDIDEVYEKVKQLKIKPDRPQYSTTWITTARRAIRDLGVLPGRHVILIARDTESEETDQDPHSAMHVVRNPWLTRISPTIFEQDARFASAQLYAVQASGPGVVIPFRGAVEGSPAVDPANPGPDILNQISEDNSRLAEQRSELMGTANNTGGRVEPDIGGALKDASKDAGGYYQLRFRPDPTMLDGSYHPIAVSVRAPHMRVFASSWYLAPQTTRPELSVAMPVVLLNALKSTSDLKGVTIASRAWYFPNRSNGLATVPLVAEIVANSSPAEKSIPPQISATVFDERQGTLIGTSTAVLTWEEEQDSRSGTDVLHAYWSKTVNLPPGSYQFRVAALDGSTGALGRASWRFLIRSADPESQLAASSIVIARDCASETIQGAEKRDLLDPLLWRDCRLQPTAAAVFHESDTLRALLRLYPAGSLAKTFPLRWHAWLKCWEPGHGRSITLPVPIQAISGAGWATFAELPIAKLGLPSGDYQINITVAGPNPNQTLSMQSRFQVVARK